MNYTRMELKVCEGCGALWLRNGCSGPALHHGTNTACLRTDVYCKPCTRLLAALPAARGPKKNSRIRVRVRQPHNAAKPVAVVAMQQGGAR